MIPHSGTGQTAGPATVVDEGYESLSPEDAWALLVDGDVGRVALTMRALPAIVPVRYAVIDRSIVFRTARGSTISAAAGGAVVAFAVDDFERQNPSGWSVLAVGRAEVVRESDPTFEALASDFLPPAGGCSSLVRIRPELVSGRRAVT